MIQRITACREITVYTLSPGTEAGASCCTAGAHPAAESSIQRGLHRSATAAPAALCSHGSGSGREGHSPQTCPEPGVLCPLGCFPSVTPACSHVSVSAELSHRCCPPPQNKFSQLSHARPPAPNSTEGRFFFPHSWTATEFVQHSSPTPCRCQGRSHVTATQRLPSAHLGGCVQTSALHSTHRISAGPSFTC